MLSMCSLYLVRRPLSLTPGYLTSPTLDLWHREEGRVLRYQVMYPNCQLRQYSFFFHEVQLQYYIESPPLRTCHMDIFQHYFNVLYNIGIKSSNSYILNLLTLTSQLQFNGLTPFTVSVSLALDSHRPSVV